MIEPLAHAHELGLTGVRLHGRHKLVLHVFLLPLLLLVDLICHLLVLADETIEVNLVARQMLALRHSLLHFVFNLVDVPFKQSYFVQVFRLLSLLHTH